MSNVQDICDAIGRARLARALGRTKGAITNGISDGSFPSRWYLVVKKLCDAKGVDCPDSLFSFVECGKQNITPKQTTPEDAEAS